MKTSSCIAIVLGVLAAPVNPQSPTRTAGPQSSAARPSTLGRTVSPSHKVPDAKPRRRESDASSNIRIAESYGKLPLAFEANRGQTDAAVQFVSRGAGYTLFLTSTEAVLALRKVQHQSLGGTPVPSGHLERGGATVLRMKLIDSNATPQFLPHEQLPGRSNYLLGGDRRDWHTDVPRYARVEYKNVYPGVDVVYYGNQQQLEYDFVVAPGANPDAIELAFDGAHGIHLNDAGELLLEAGDGEIRLGPPLIYQEIDGRRVTVPGGYKTTPGGRIAFRVGAYDSTKTLVVDPIVVYSSYLGGSSQDYALGIAVGDGGAAYVTGLTTSIDFPTSGAMQPACAANGNSYPDCADVFVTTLPGYGGSPGYSTYLGGTSLDVGTAIAVDAAGAAYVTGRTRSHDFPTINAVQPSFDDNSYADTRAFVAKLSADGSALEYSTYLGGDEPWIAANSIAVDTDGAAYVAGGAGGFGSSIDALVIKLTPDGSAVAYSRRLGGSGNDVGYGIAVDPQGFASVVGGTDSADFPRLNSSQPQSGGFAFKLFPDGTLLYSTFLFGSGSGIALAGPYTYVTGVMRGVGGSGGLPPPVGSGGGATDAFVEALDFGGRPVNGTYFGGSGNERGSAIGVDRTGSVWIAGVTSSTDFPLVNPLQGRVRDVDAFVTRFNPALQPVFSTYLGGTGREQVGTGLLPELGPLGPALVVDHQYTAAYVAGFTDSTDFPAAGPSGQPAGQGAVHSFVALIVDDGVPTKADLVVTEVGGMPAEVQLGATTLGYLLEVTNKGPAPATDVTFLDKLPRGVVVDQVLLGAPPSFLRHCDHDASFVFCTLDKLLEGETVFIAITATATSVGTETNTAAVTQTLSPAFTNWFHGITEGLTWGPQDAARDRDLHDNVVTTTTVVTQASADVSVTGAAPALVMLDGTITYTLDVENHGPATTVAATLVDTLPAGAAFISATHSGSGNCTGTSVIICEMPALSGIDHVTIVARATAPGNLTNTAVLSTAAPDPNSVNNTVTLITRVNRPPTANAGPDQVVSAGSNCQAMVTLDGTASSDADVDPLTYTWTSESLLPPPILSSSTGGAVTGPTPSRPLPLGTHAITLTVNDGHGGTASDSVIVTVRDVTAPVFSGVPAPVTVEQSNPLGAAVAMPLPSAIDNCGGSVAVSSNAPAMFPPGPTTVTFTARDAAGNSATASTIVTVVDTTSPTVGISSPAARDYQHSGNVTVGFSSTDSGSGLAPRMPAATLDGAAVTNGQTIQLLTLGLGPHTFIALAVDQAGNSVNRSVTFRIIATIDSLVAAVNTLGAQAQIDNPSMTRSLLVKLNDAKEALDSGNTTLARSKLQDFIDHVTAQSGRRITAGAAQILIADAQYVMGALP